MKFQWNLLFGLLFAIIIAVFAIVNVDAVTSELCVRQSRMATRSYHFMFSAPRCRCKWICCDVPFGHVKSSRLKNFRRISW